MGGADDLFGQEAPQVNGADALFAEEEDGSERQLKFVMDSAVDEKPDRAARALEIQQKTGVPKKFIDDNFDEIDRTARQADFDAKQYTKSNPKVSQWLLKNPDYAPLIREDSDSLSKLENLFSSKGDTWGTVAEKGYKTTSHSLNRSFVAGAEMLFGAAQEAPLTTAENIGKSTVRTLGYILGGMAWVADSAGKYATFDSDKVSSFKDTIAMIDRNTPDASYSPEEMSNIEKNPLYREGFDRAKYHTEQIQDNRPNVQDWSAKDLAFAAGTSIFSNVLPTVVGSIAAGPVGGTATFSGQVFSDAVAEETANGKTLTQAMDYATWKVFSEGIPESIPLAAAHKLGVGFWKKIATVSAVEGAEEIMTELADIAYEKYKQDKDITLTEGIGRVLKSGVVGAISGSVLGASHAAPNSISLAIEGRKNKAFFEALGETTTNSKLYEKLPDSYQQIVKDLTKDGPVENVYAPVEFFQSHFQDQNIDPRKLATELGIERQYDEAVNTGGKIAIPLDVYAKNLAPTEHNAVFAKELSFGPDQMSSRETDEFLKEAEKEKEPETDTFGESLEQAMTPIREQLKAIYPTDVADKNAAVIEARLRSRATRLGIDPQELMKQRPMSIVEGGAETGSVLNQIAYHGSPYQFQRFDMSKIGTGEGAQAYGHGLYFAESPAVAGEYQKALSRNLDGQKLDDVRYSWKRSGVEIDAYPSNNGQITLSKLVVNKDKRSQGLGTEAMRDLVAHADDTGKIIKLSPSTDFGGSSVARLKEFYKRFGFVENKGRNKDFAISETMYRKPEERGAFYKVDISDTAIKNFLDWDKPLSEQPENVKAAMKKAGYKEDAFHMTGGELYKDTSFDLDGTKGNEPATELFKKAGIPGIRYLDGTSRKDVKGTYNFVVFDDSIIKILDVNGKPVSQKEQDKIVGAMRKEQDGGNELMQKQTETPEFTKWFGESKVADESGKPVVVYHGTDKSFTKFNPKKATMGGIHWFTSDKAAIEAGEVGAQGKGKILELYASLKNPAGWEEYHKYGLGELKARGYDGAILPESDGTFTGFFFEPTQVKSATRNRGTFDPNDPNILKQEGQDVKRGSISVSPTGDVIRLFQAKNLSTLLHELSHRWLFEMQDDAALPNAPQQIKDDLAATLKYLGVESVEELDITKIPKGTAAYKKAVAANEKFAESGEAYLMEGKAPSSALRRVFAQIRAWLVAVYKALKQGRLNAELTDEMRGVFDRLLATDEEIKSAKAEANVVPIFTTADDAGMTDPEFAAYRKTIEDANREAQEELDSKVMREYKKTLTDLWKEEKTKVQSEVEAEIDTVLIYAASAKMKANGIKISKDSIQNIGIASNIHRSLVAKDGITPDMAAELLGFTSGEALIRELSTAEPRDSRVRRETNVRMDQKFGNMIADGSVMEEAKKAVMGDGRAKTIEAEIKALNKKVREVKPFVKGQGKAQKEKTRAGRDLYKALVPKLADVRANAASVIARKPIRELRPMQYYNAARQASREAVNDVRKSDYLMAGYNKGRELLNLELYREAIKAQDMIEDGNQKLQKVFVADIKQSKSRNMDMVNAARAILASHGLGKSDATPSSYLEKMRQYEPEIYENLRPIFEPAISSMKPFKEMTVEEYVGMRDAVFALIKTSRRSKQMEIDGKLIERDEAVASLVNRIMDLDKGKSKELRSTLDDMQKTKIGLLSAKSALRRVESWVTAMDGGPDGAFRKYIWNPVSDAVNQYRDKKREVVTRYLDIVQQVAPTIKPGDIEAPELGFKFRGKNELLHALLHTGNDSNKDKLLIGYGWGERNEEGVLNTAKWDAFEKRMRDQGKLTKADYDFAQNVWDMMEGMKPTLQEAHHRMYGYYFNEVTANEFTNEFGTYRGGYVPAKVDVNVVQEAEQRKDAEEIVQGQNSFAFPTSGKGATMSRSEGYARPLQLDMRTIPAHIDWAMRFAYLEPSVKDVARVVLDKDFAKSMNGLDQTTINHMLVPWLQRTAQQITSTRGMNKWVDKFWTGVRSRSGMQVMVLNVINTLQQYTGLTIAFTRVKPSNIRSAFWSYMTKHKEFSEEVSEKSSFMRNRVFTSHNEVMQTIDDLLLNPSKYEKAKDFATKHGYFMQQATQGFVDQIVWHAAYSESLSKGQDDKESVRHADSVVRETQGSFAPEDISRFEAGTPFVRAFSMFYNYFNMQANLLGTEAAKISNDLGLRKGAGRALYVYTFAFMIPAYIGGAIIRALVAGGADEDDDDEYQDDIIRMFFGSQFEAATAMVPVVGQLLNTAVNQWNKKWYDDKITVSPAVTAVESSVRAPYSVYKAIVEDGNEKRAVKDVLYLIGMATGLPAGALSRPLGYLADVHQGKANPENALDVARGLISGQDVNR